MCYGLLVVFSALPHGAVVEADCDVIERNVVGIDRSFKQWVFWDYLSHDTPEAEHPDRCARAWVAIHSGEKVQFLRGQYVLSLYRFGKLIRVRAPAYKSTWTGVDHEVLNRKQVECCRWNSSWRK